MYGRITSAMVRQTMLNNIDSGLSALQRTSEEMSSGRKILEPSDDPYGASQVVTLNSQLEGLKSYATAAQEGVSWENVSSGAMSDIGEALQKVRVLVVQASNGTTSQTDLNAMAGEVEQLTESIKQAANTQYAGQYVFSGTATTTAPYEGGASDTYKGDEGTIARSIAPGVSVPVNTNISTLLGNGAGAEDGKLLDTLRTIATDMRSGATEALQSGSLKALDASAETLDVLQASAGGTTDQLQVAGERIESLQLAVTQSLSNVDDANLAETSIAYSNEQAAYTAALHAGATIVQESLMNFLSG